MKRKRSESKDKRVETPRFDSLINKTNGYKQRHRRHIRRYTSHYTKAACFKHFIDTQTVHCVSEIQQLALWLFAFFRLVSFSCFLLSIFYNARAFGFVMSLLITIAALRFLAPAAAAFFFLDSFHGNPGWLGDLNVLSGTATPKKQKLTEILRTVLSETYFFQLFV